jgi:chromosomal replication initiation ATPase DnaA
MDAEFIEITRSEAKMVQIILHRCLSRTGVNAFRFKVKKEKEVKICNYTYDTIVDAICEASGVSKENLRGTCRKREYSDMRAVTSAIVTELWPELSLREVGSFTDRGDHSTVIKHLKNVENIPEIQALYREIKFKIKI